MTNKKNQLRTVFRLLQKLGGADLPLEKLLRLFGLISAGDGLEVTITSQNPFPLPGGGPCTITGWVNAPQPLSLQGWIVGSGNVQTLAVGMGSTSWSWGNVQVPQVPNNVYTWNVRAYYVDQYQTPHAVQDSIDIQT